PTGPVTRVLPRTETTASETSPSLVDEPNTDTTAIAFSPFASVVSWPTETISCAVLPESSSASAATGGVGAGAAFCAGGTGSAGACARAGSDAAQISSATERMELRVSLFIYIASDKPWPRDQRARDTVPRRVRW